MPKHRHSHSHIHHNVHAHQTPAHVTAFINAHVEKAQEISKRTLIPISMILAQAAEESSWGRAAPDNAYFGIKGKSSTGGSFAKEIGRSGYATNPKYGANLVSIITVYKLTQYEVNPMKQRAPAAGVKK